MRYLLLSILTLLLAAPASAAELLIIQSQSNAAYDQAVRLLQNSCGGNNQTYVLADYAEFDLGRVVREERPRLVIAVGDKPHKEALKLRTTPVLYTMALAAEEKPYKENITGISMNAAPEHYFRLLKKLGLHRAGVVYSQAKNGDYLERARKIAPGYGIELVPAAVKSPQEVDAALSKLRGKDIDALWMIPDTTAVTAETIDAYFNLAQKSGLPLISFARSYLGKGALAVLEASRIGLTKQLCNNVQKILNGTAPAKIAVSDIAEVALYTNENVAQKLGISLSGTEQLFRTNRE